MVENGEIIPVFGAHQVGRVHFRGIEEAKRSRNSDLIPAVYNWSEVTNLLVAALKPSIMALDSVAPGIPPKLIPYYCPGDLFELKGERRNLFLVGSDVIPDTVKGSKGLGKLSEAAIRQYWQKNGMWSSNPAIPKYFGGLPDILPFALLIGGSQLAPAVEQKIALMGLSAIYLARTVLAYPIFIGIEERHQLVRRSGLFRSLLNFSRPISYRLETIDLRNAITAVKLTDVQDYIGADEWSDGSTVAVFGTGHALGKNLWNQTDRQRAIVVRETKRIIAIAEKADRSKSLGNEKQETRLVRDISRYLGNIGIWRIKERPRLMNYHNFSQRVPLEETFTSPTISDMVETAANEYWS